MREKIQKLMNQKFFHVGVIIVIVVILLFILGFVVLRYHVEGETNMPFELSKVVIISSSEGTDREGGQTKWSFDVNQNNDIFFYLEKNKNYGKEEVIDQVVIENIKVEKSQEKGIIKFYRPEPNAEKKMFFNVETNEIEKLEYQAELESDVKQLKISNQGGIIAFRYANNQVAEYHSDEEEINHMELLKKAGVTEEELKAELTFDFIIKVKSGKEYKANMSLTMPVEGVVEKGTTSTEITDKKDFIFKRIKN